MVGVTRRNGALGNYLKNVIYGQMMDTNGGNSGCRESTSKSLKEKPNTKQS